TALISGSSQGIGFAIAQALAKEGVNVVINSSKPDQVDKAIHQLSKAEPDVQISGVVADLSTARGVQDLVQKVPAVDILVNNVGFAETTTGTGIAVNSVLAGPTRSEGVEAIIRQMVTSRGVSEESSDSYCQKRSPRWPLTFAVHWLRPRT